MRSRKVSPAFAVTRTTIRSDSTRVPPVTPERSPPDSRTTGADSPVMADSSMLATPSMISPSLGTTCPATISTTSPARSAVDTVASRRSPTRRTAGLACRVWRRASAWALPRASARASAKLANSTVSSSQPSSASR
jgi:hypothetical protein